MNSMRSRSNAITDAARKAGFITAIGASALAFSNASFGQDKKPDDNTKTSLTVRQTAGVYNKGDTPFLGLGVSGSLSREWVRLDTTTDIYFPELKNAALDHAEADITFPMKPLSLMPFAYRSAYYGDVPLGVGIGVHLPYNLHICPHWIEGANTFPVPIAWTPSIGKLSLLFKAIPVANHAAKQLPAPLIGAEVMISYKLADSVGIYVKGFEMTKRDKDGGLAVGVLNTQAGFSWSW